MDITRIVVGVDFSPESEVAARYAVKIGRHTGAEVVLVHVGMVIDREPAGPRSGISAVSQQWEQLITSQLAADRDKLSDLRSRLASNLPEVSQMVIDGFADTGLCEAAKTLGANLIITGTRGRTAIQRFFLGSVAERVVRMCETNVMVARAGADEGSSTFKRILVPTDFSPQSEQALRLAMILAGENSEIDVFHAWNTPPEMALEWSGPILKELASEVDEAGKKILESHRRDDLTIRFSAIRAFAAEGIADRLDERPYDLVVMGSHGRRGLRRFLLGSIAEKTVRHAPCSVIVVHQGSDVE